MKSGLSCGAVLAAVLLVAARNPPPGLAQSGPTLQSLASKRNFTMGAGASDPAELNDPRYAAIAAGQYSALEPANVMKMLHLEPSRGVYSFSAADTVAAFAQAHGQRVTATAPIWDGKATDYGTGNPAWLMDGGFSAAQLETILHDYIVTVMRHYRKRYPGIVNRWSIVSEATHLCGVFCQGLGKDASGFPAYVALSYEFAREADPTIQLCYDDWGGEGLGPASDKIYKLVSYLKSKRLIDCVGLEGQWEGSMIGHIPKASDIVRNIDRLGALGLDVYFSQVEIGLPVSNENNPSDLTAQANQYATLLQACLSTTTCKSFFTWGITDKYAFCWNPRYCAPLPFDANYNPKPAFYALQTVLSHAAPATAEPRAASPAGEAIKRSACEESRVFIIGATQFLLGLANDFGNGVRVRTATLLPKESGR